MNRNLMNIVVFLILLVIFITGFSNSYTSHNISNLAYVLAIGIDKGEKTKLKISAQFSKSAIFSSGSGSSSEDASNIILVSGEADSIFSGLNLLNSYIGKELNLAHCSVIIFSEEFAKEGISTEIFSLINNEEVRPSTNLVISKCFINPGPIYKRIQFASRGNVDRHDKRTSHIVIYVTDNKEAK